VAQHKRKGQPGRGGGARGGGQGMFYVVLGVIALVGIGAIFYAVRGGGGGGAATEMVDVDVADARDLYQQATPKRLGDDAAPVKIVVFSDFMCPGCGAFALSERPRIMPWVEAGQAQYISYDYVLGSFPHSFLASRAARCAAEQPLAGSEDGTGYWPYHDLLYQRRDSYAGQSQRDVVGTFIGYGQEIGLDTRAFEQCVRSDRYADTVSANRMVGDQLGVRGTPTVLVNNRRVVGSHIREMGDEVIRMLRETVGEPGSR
jgi:protein-disulfide isomerase